MLSQSDVVRLLLRDRIKILSYVDSFLNDAQLAEDCFQETCAAAVAKDLAFEDETHLLRWALRVGRNKSIDLVRRRTRQPVVLEDDVLDALEKQWLSTQTVASEFQADRVEKLHACLDRLTDNNRRIVDLRYNDGLKTGRIAELLGRKVESVYKALIRTHAALRACMQENPRGTQS